jgi:ATP-dependent DNA helicase PIF1
MTQEEAFSIMKTGANVFLTGEAGSGKTHTVNRYTAYLRQHHVEYAVTASTGIAATHIGGVTIHSWSGIGIARTADDQSVSDIAANPFIAKRIRKAKVLIIDEISMLDGGIFSFVELVCRKVRKNRLPFGGLQVIAVGDFFQLPPVPEAGRSAAFAFESDAWRMLEFRVCYLSEQYRQEDDAFFEVLSSIRKNSCGAAGRRLLESRLEPDEELPDDVTKLFSHNLDVDRINALELRKLPGKTFRFVMADRGPQAIADALKRGCLSPEELELKEGAVVMFTKNNPGGGYVNGTLGTVIGFDKERRFPVVETRSGDRIIVEPAEWSIMDGDTTLARITQLPLRLAWAMTIHKSQGVSLDAAVIDLSKTFEFGQGYVALSRVRRLSGVYLVGLNDRALEVHPEVLAEDTAFRKKSEDASVWLQKMSSSDRRAIERHFIIIAGGRTDVRKSSDQEQPKKKRGRPKKLAVVEDGKHRTLSDLRKNHAAAYRPWSAEEERELTRLFRRGVQLAEISKKLGRQPGGIQARLKKLGLAGI